MRKWVCCELPPPPECPKHSERHKHPARPIPPELTERPALQKQDEKNSYLEEKFLAQTKTVLRVQLVIAVLICLVLSFIFSIFLSGRLSDEQFPRFKNAPHPHKRLCRKYRRIFMAERRALQARCGNNCSRN